MDTVTSSLNERLLLPFTLRFWVGDGVSRCVLVAEGEVDAVRCDGVDTSDWEGDDDRCEALASRDDVTVADAIGDPENLDDLVKSRDGDAVEDFSRVGDFFDLESVT